METTTRKGTVMKRQPIRQGDVLLVPMSEKDIPEQHNEVPRNGDRVILAYGEVTGHAHSIIDDEVRLVTSEQAEQLRTWLLVETDAPVELVHDEHATVMVPPGAYEVRRQQEYAPEAIRQVAD